MMKQLLQRKIVRRIGLYLLISLVVGVLFMLYILVIGIPKTRARNLYNQGEILEMIGKTDSAQSYYQQAYDTWPEGYIQPKLEN